MRENKDWGLRKVAFGRNNRVVELTRFEMKKLNVWAFVWATKSGCYKGVVLGGRMAGFH